MSNAADIVITGMGLASPVGFSAARGLTAIRAGITRIVAHPHYCPRKSPGYAGDAEGDPSVHVAAVLDLDDDEDDDQEGGAERLVRLALLALQGLFHEAPYERSDIPRTALLAALPAPDRVVAGWGLGQRFLSDVNRRGRVERWAAGETCEMGAPGTIRMIERARAILQGGMAGRAIVLAADTYMDVPRLAHLDEAYRLKSPRNVDGFIPGEAAVALLLETSRSAAERMATPLASIGATGFGTEPVTVGAEGWSTGAGLSAAIEAVLAASPPRALGEWTLCNLNGESYRAREWGIVLGRLSEALAPPQKLSHPADTIGDPGAAMGGLLVALAAYMLARRHAPASSALIWATSDDASRAALSLTAHR